MNRPPLLFLDTSVVMAAVFSPRGGSFGIIELARDGIIDLVITELVVKEAYRKVNQKYGQIEVTMLSQLLFEHKLNINPSPTDHELRQYDRLIADLNDRHILAGATKYKVDSLITFDRKHFFTETLQRANLGFIIELPNQFLTRYRKETENKG